MRGLKKIYEDRHTHTYADRHLNTMNRPSLRAGPIENCICRKIPSNTLGLDATFPVDRKSPSKKTNSYKKFIEVTHLRSREAV